jgi:predicted molibdopterin-dependent oxidoreductase YjgC
MVMNNQIEERAKDFRRTTCMFCSMGCGVAFRAAGDNITAIDYDKENPVNHGAICPRGYYNFELLNHPKKLNAPYIGEHKSSWNEANAFIKEGLKHFKGPDIGILLSMNSMNEDAYMAARMAEVLNTSNVTAYGDHADIDTFLGLTQSGQLQNFAEVNKIGSFETLLIIGDVLTRSPVLSKQINKVKYSKRGNQIIVIDSDASHTAWFATQHLKPKAGTESLLVAAILKVIADLNSRGPIDLDLNKASEVTGVPVALITRAAKTFDDSLSSCVIFAPKASTPGNGQIEHFVNQLSSYSVGSKHITFYSYGNAYGVNKILEAQAKGHATHEDVMEKVMNGTIKALFIFGEDIPNLPKSLKMTVKGVYFKNGTADNSTVTLPLASYMERKGTIALAGDRNLTLIPIVHKVGGRAIWKIISNISPVNIGFDEILRQTQECIYFCGVVEPADTNSIVQKAAASAKEMPGIPMNITHFGNNELVKNFYWWRVNNG